MAAVKVIRTVDKDTEPHLVMFRKACPVGWTLMLLVVVSAYFGQVRLADHAHLPTLSSIPALMVTGGAMFANLCSEHESSLNL